MTHASDPIDDRAPPDRARLATAAGLAGSVALAVIWHAFGFVERPPEPSYPLSQYFVNCFGLPFGVAFAAVGFLIGRLTRSARFTAAGMLLPLPIATIIEVVRDRTSHNMLGFEIVLYWVPAFAVAFAGAYLGRRSAARTRDGTPVDR